MHRWMGCVLYFFFFFFKQKTAYEIYQCDWSSDVCSSDLYPIKIFPEILSDLLKNREVGLSKTEPNKPAHNVGFHVVSRHAMLGFVSHRIPSGFIMDFLNLLRRILVSLSPSTYI